jgi:hypothetical protein
MFQMICLFVKLEVVRKLNFLVLHADEELQRDGLSDGN